jgi:glycosyl transferase family 1/glycosyl transferase family 4
MFARIPGLSTASRSALRILWVGTKPPFPALDGGRLVVVHTIRALQAAGHVVTLVAPFDPRREDGSRGALALREWCEPVLVASSPRPLLRSALLSVPRREPVSVVRHTHPSVRAKVEELLAGRTFDVVHAEQPQALAQCAPAGARGLPVVLRAQNVESDLWAAAAGGRPLAGALARIEARRMARFEGGAVRAAAATVALTARDADRLGLLAGVPGKVHHVPAPFPCSLPAAEAALPGAPALVLVGSGGWLPNERGSSWFVSDVWPRVRRALPAAVLHVFGGSPSGPPAAEGVVRHPAPGDSRQAFAPGAVLVVPLTFGSGVRMKILEAWARGAPVVATPAAALGLEAEDGRDLLLAATADGFVDALSRLTREPGLAPSLAAAGRQRLESGHAPAAVASRLAAVYEACLAGPRPRS